MGAFKSLLLVIYAAYPVKIFEFSQRENFEAAMLPWKFQVDSTRKLCVWLTWKNMWLTLTSSLFSGRLNLKILIWSNQRILWRHSIIQYIPTLHSSSTLEWINLHLISIMGLKFWVDPTALLDSKLYPTSVKTWCLFLHEMLTLLIFIIYCWPKCSVCVFEIHELWAGFCHALQECQQQRLTDTHVFWSWNLYMDIWSIKLGILFIRLRTRDWRILKLLHEFFLRIVSLAN